MKRIIEPMKEFESELTSETPDADYEPSPYYRYAPKPSFKLIKKSFCIARYEAEPDDQLTHARLLQELKTPFDVANHRATKEEAEQSQKRLGFFSKLLDMALKETLEVLDYMRYVETSDSYTLHAHAEYRYNNGWIEQFFPCKVGEPLTFKMNSDTLAFERINR